MDGTRTRRSPWLPLRDRRFWVVQGLVALVFVLHELDDGHLGIREFTAVPHVAVEALFLFPLLYAALNFGLRPSLVTAGWVTVLMTVDITLDLPSLSPLNLWAHYVELATLDVLTITVGRGVESERRARRRAEAAENRATRYAALVVQAEETERQRLARDLHDDPLQLFLHFARQLEALAQKPEVPVPVAHELGEVRSQALDAAARLSDLTRDLRPSVLDHLGLVSALSSLCRQAEKRGLTAELQVTGERVDLTPEVELATFRIAEEAIRNVLRHAAACELCVAADFRLDELVVTVTDDGQGFTPESLGEPIATQLGVLGMTERATLLGGRLEVRSAPGRGTVVEARVPLSRRAVD